MQRPAGRQASQNFLHAGQILPAEAQTLEVLSVEEIRPVPDRQSSEVLVEVHVIGKLHFATVSRKLFSNIES